MSAKPVLKYPGAKWTLAAWIVGHLPKHDVYLEPFFGSGAVFFTKQRSRVETVNDVSGEVVNFFRVLRDEGDELARRLALTPWAREEYEASYLPCADPIERARRFTVRCWQAHGSRTGARVGWRNDAIGHMRQTIGKTWTLVPARAHVASARLQGVQIECRPALEVIQRHADANVLIYADPPYVAQTRMENLYAHEMTDADHVALLDALDAHPGPVVLSGYRCPLYDDRLTHWQRLDVPATAEGGRARVESLWLNRQAARPTLFELASVEAV